MVQLTQESTIKYNVQSSGAVAQTNKLGEAQAKLGGTASSLGSGFGSLATQTIAVSGAQEKLGVNAGFLGGTLGILGQSMAALNPIMIAGVLAATAVATAFLSKQKAAEDLSKTLESLEGNLRTLADSESSFAGIAKDLLEIRRAGLLVEKAQIEQKLTFAEAGLRETSFWEKALGAMESYAQTGYAIPDVYKQMQEGSDEYTQALAEQAAALGEVIKKLDDLGPTAKDASGDILRLRNQVVRLQDAAFKDVGGDLGELNAIFAERQAIIEEAAAMEIEKAEGNARLIALIEEKKQLQIEALLLEYTERSIELQDQQTITVESNAERQLQAWVRTYQMQETLAEKASRVQIGFMRSINKTAKEMEAGRISILQAGAKAVLLTVTDTVASELEIRAKLWAAQAIAAAASFNFASAALYAAAAAAAGAGASFIRSQADRAFLESDRDPISDEPAIAGAEVGGPERSGRTLVQRGPVNLTFISNLSIHGHVIGIDDLEEVFVDWYQTLLRRANLDVSEASEIK